MLHILQTTRYTSLSVLNICVTLFFLKLILFFIFFLKLCVGHLKAYERKAEGFLKHMNICCSECQNQLLQTVDSAAGIQTRAISKHNRAFFCFIAFIGLCFFCQHFVTFMLVKIILFLGPLHSREWHVDISTYSAF